MAGTWLWHLQTPQALPCGMCHMALARLWARACRRSPCCAGRHAAPTCLGVGACCACWCHGAEPQTWGLSISQHSHFFFALHHSHRRPSMCLSHNFTCMITYLPTCARAHTCEAGFTYLQLKSAAVFVHAQRAWAPASMCGRRPIGSVRPGTRPLPPAPWPRQPGRRPQARPAPAHEFCWCRSPAAGRLRAPGLPPR